MKRLRIAIQKSGKLSATSEAYIRGLGLDFTRQDRQIIAPVTNRPIDILYVRDDDIPEYVVTGAADYGVVGLNEIAEQAADVVVAEQLGFGLCRLVIAAPKNSALKTVLDMEGERIATSYPRLLKSYLATAGVHAAIIPIMGAVEAAPELNVADAVCDLTQTGTTLRAHGLVELATVLESQAALIQAQGQTKSLANHL